MADSFRLPRINTQHKESGLPSIVVELAYEHPLVAAIEGMSGATVECGLGIGTSWRWPGSTCIWRGQVTGEAEDCPGSFYTRGEIKIQPDHCEATASAEYQCPEVER